MSLPLISSLFYYIVSRYFLQGNHNNSPPIVPVIKRGEQMKQILKGNKVRRMQYVMKGSKKKIILDIVIDVKYLKGKREKRGCENLGFVVLWSQVVSKKGQY